SAYMGGSALYAADGATTLRGVEVVDNHVRASFNGFGALMFEGTSTEVVDSVIAGNTGYWTRGGGITAGTDLTVRDTTIRDNQVMFGDKRYLDVALSDGTGGAGIWFKSATSDLTLEDTTVADNLLAAGGGGAIDVDAADAVTIRDSRISGSHATGWGGGLAVGSPSQTSPAASRFVLEDSTVRGNTVTSAQDMLYGGGDQGRLRGAGIHVNVESATIDSSTLTGNKVHEHTGVAQFTAIERYWGILAHGNGGQGAGIAGDADTFTLRNSTVAGNTTTAGLGAGHRSDTGDYDPRPAQTPTPVGVWVTSNNANIQNSTIARNAGGGVLVEGGTYNIDSAILSGNIQSGLVGDNVPSGWPEKKAVDLVQTGGTLNVSYSLIETANGGHGGTNGENGNIVGLDPKLGPLSDNGGTTQTHGLLPGSPAIDAGGNADDITWEQRGSDYYRNRYDSPDMGAFEVQAEPRLPAIENQQTLEDQTYTFTAPEGHFDDPEADEPLAYSAARADGSDLPDWLHFDPETRTFSGTPANADGGTITMQVTATDIRGATATRTFDLTVENVNDAPAISGLPADITVTEDAASDVDFSDATFTDEDAGAHVITLTLTADAGTLSASAADGVTVTGSGTGELTLAGPEAAIDACLKDGSHISYTGAKDAWGDDAAAITLTANDNGYSGRGGGTDVTLGTVAINITPVIDTPEGAGTEADPYRVDSLADLKCIISEPWAEGRDAHYVQTANIDASMTRYWDDTDDNNDGNPYNDPNDATAAGDNDGFLPIGSGAQFTGSYDGGGYTISGLAINRPDATDVGFFAALDGAAVRNIDLDAVDITGQTNVGGLAGATLGSATVAGCTVTGSVSGSGARIGGLVGYQYNNAVLRNGYSMAAVEGGGPVGGLVGQLDASAGDTAAIANAYSTGKVTGNAHVGGLVGRKSENASVTEAFWDTRTSGQDKSAAGTGLTTVEMTDFSTFNDAGWDFMEETENGTTSRWGLNHTENGGYPFLSWQGYPHVPFVGLKVVNGLGSGKHKAQAPVTVSADTPPEGRVFYRWTGDTDTMANVFLPNTRVIMAAEGAADAASAASMTVRTPAAGLMNAFAADPDGELTVTANYREQGSTAYALTVNSGEESGGYLPGETVRLSANAPAEGQVFDQWTGDTQRIVNVHLPDTTLYMPFADAEVTATYKQQGSVSYALEVVDGSGGGDFLPGETVSLSADPPPEGLVFDQWTGDTENVANINLPETRLRMPASDIKVTAIYKKAGTKKYQLHVSGGYDGGRYRPGTPVDIAAVTTSNLHFVRWTGHTAWIADPKTSDTTFWMPAEDAGITAEFTLSPADEVETDSGSSGCFIDGICP
ncbi:MAG: InlB B-repeat-containing protein, partial [Thermodesulfobacteriota bacterium]